MCEFLSEIPTLAHFSEYTLNQFFIFLICDW